MQPSGGVPRCIQLVRPGAQPVAGAAQIGVGEPGPQLFNEVAAEEPTRSASRQVHAECNRPGGSATLHPAGQVPTARVSAGHRSGPDWCRWARTAVCSLEWLRKNRLDRLAGRSARPGRRRRRSPASARQWRPRRKPASGPPDRGTAETTPNTETAGPVSRRSVSRGAVMRRVVSVGAVMRQPVSRRGRRPPIHQPRRTLPAHGIAVCQRPRQPA